MAKKRAPSRQPNVISDYDPIAEFEREIEGRPRPDGSNVASDYDPIAAFEREPGGRLFTPPRRPRRTAAPPNKEPTFREKGAAKAKPRKRKQSRMYQRYAGDDALAAEGRAGVNSGKFSNAWQAAQALGPRAEGSATDAAKIHRLHKKILHPRKISKRLETSLNK